MYSQLGVEQRPRARPRLARARRTAPSPLLLCQGRPQFAGSESCVAATRSNPSRQLVVAAMRGMRQCMCVTGEEWLRRTFDPALRTSKPLYEELRTEFGALSDSGVLSEDEASRARVRLDEGERDRHMIVRQRTERAIHASRVGVAEDRLEGLLTRRHGPRRLKPSPRATLCASPRSPARSQAAESPPSPRRCHRSRFGHALTRFWLG